MLRLLIAEDNTARALLLKSHCQSAGFEPNLVTSGLAALEEVLSGAFDYILMDLDMPDLDGIAATISIRDLKRDIHQPVVIGLAEDVSAETEQACLAAGMDGVIGKALEKEDFLARLQTLGVEAEAGTSQDALRRRVFAALRPHRDRAAWPAFFYLSFAPIREDLGMAWEHAQARVESAIAAVFDLHGAPETVHEPCGPLAYALAFPALDLAAGEAKCAAIAGEVCHRLLGDAGMRRLTLQPVTFAQTAPPAEAAPDTQGAAYLELIQFDSRYLPEDKIFPEIKVEFWPVWDTQRRRFPLHEITGSFPDGTPLAQKIAESGEDELEAYEKFDLTLLIRFLQRLDGYETLEAPALIILPVHYLTLSTIASRLHYAFCLDYLPKKVRERLVVMIVEPPNDLRTAQLADVQAPLLAHCLNITVAVPPTFSNFNTLKQNRIQFACIELTELGRDPAADMNLLKRFDLAAKRFGLVTAATQIRTREHRDWALARCRYVAGPAIADMVARLGQAPKLNR